MSEIEMLRALAGSRSEEAFSELVRRYAGLVYSTAKRRLANPSLAEDITQMVFIRFAKNPPKVQNHAELAAWLHRTTVNVSIDFWRSETRRRARELQAIIMETLASDTVIWEEISPKLDEALNQLNDEDRQALLLRFFSRKTMREVGALLGVSEDAAKMRVSRAVDRLRTQMGAAATACTAAVLSTLLIERSVEATPAQLVARLAAIKLSTAAGMAGTGILATLFRISKFKVALSAAALAFLILTAIHFAHSSAISEMPANPQASITNGQSASTGHEPLGALSSPLNVSPPPPPRAVMLFHVLDAETVGPLPNTTIHAPTFGIGGMGIGHDLLTDSNGTAAISVPADSTNNLCMNVFAVAEGHVPKVVSFRGSLPPYYTMKLDRATTAGGVIEDEQGHPVAGAKVYIQTPGVDMKKKENIDFQTCPAMTDSNGNWGCSDVPLDCTNEITFIIKKKNYATTYPVVSVPETNLSHLVLVLNNGFTIIGRVTDSQGQPIPHARITSIDAHLDAGATTKTDNNGDFILKGVRNAPEFYKGDRSFNSLGANPLGNQAANESSHADLAIEAIGFAPLTAEVNLSTVTNVANYTLTWSKILRGHVVDESGHPIPNAMVQTDWNNQGLRAFDWQIRTDIDGQFEWDSAPAGPILYWIEADGYEVERDVSLVADTSDHEIILKKATP